MDQDATPVAQKELIGVFSDWTEVVPGPDQKSVLEGVRELHTKLKANIFGAFGSDFSMRYRPCDQFGGSNRDLASMTYGQLPSAPVVLVFEPSPKGKANKHLQELGTENFGFYSVLAEFKKETDTKIWEMHCKLDETVDELRGAKETIKRHEKRIESQEKTIERQEKRIESQEKTIERQEKRIESQEKTIERQEKELNGAKKTIKRQEKRIGYLDKELSSAKKAIKRQDKTIVSLKEEHQKDHKFHAYLHLRALLDQSRKKIALEFGVEKWNAFVRENGNQCSALIYGRFANSLTLECIEFLCDDQSMVRLRGNVIAHHEETDKMQQAITDDDVVEDDRKHLLMLFDFISQEMAN
ncbi:hypothetical protein AGABI1DRAFT_105160 [Agaricus bisporus var. burnettii JB137-S8]|uniref:Uncharacterized protein n=1 Tax=Agaricus bisporus var. burnettii (strain JB137-S8 / ATCC MYA-4627 / FGSC 10392) TaxID=597362 RepID=K5W4C8_AGABU|nr:uncharacterized protein AGABI1DRAFT_105160 [Agaricus bisporus var. burnettii JB137-S8]EKM81634.1 hypothetical protein AGABI1DRAFT_105160 [Agaricus bisporus var. burnettii JB137-S8]